jgi:hypothetical protein
MKRKMIGEAIYIRVSGNVLTQSWRGKSAVFRIYSALTSNSYKKSIKAVRRQRNLGLMVKLIVKTIVINGKIHKNKRKRFYSSNKEGLIC